MNPALNVFVLCLVVLSFKMLGIGYYQTFKRSMKKAFVNPEDAKFFGKSEPLQAELVDVQRASNAYRNDLENIPIFLFLALAYVMLECWEMGATIYFWTFTIARVFHTVAYIRGLQPWRTMAFVVGQTISVIVSIHLLFKVLA
jgi:uncharacterized MAPEG superfamily protein